MLEEIQPLILFDGVCNLCNRSVQLIIKNDPKARFRFASLQSETGQAIMREYEIQSGSGFDTLILLDKNRIYTRSTAALKIAAKLKGGWPLLAGFLVTPRFLRDMVYNMIARNRYRWFGKMDECMIPTPELKRRFVG